MTFSLDKGGTVMTTHALTRHGKRITTHQYLDHTARVLAALPVYRANLEAKETTERP